MKELLKTSPWLLLLAICLYNCTFKKRLYRDGYYIDWAETKAAPKHKHIPKTDYSFRAYDALSLKPAQSVCISASDPASMSCREGTVIEFPANAFVYESGSPVKCGKICVNTWEFYSMADIIAAGLSTTSQNRMIVSSGMVYVEATCCGERLRIAPGKKMTVKMPYDGNGNKMRLFNGKLQNGIVDWQTRGRAEQGNAATITAFQNDEENDTLFSEYEGGILEGVYSGEYENQTAYIMSSANLGWINCDRFYDIEKKTSLIVKADSKKETCIALVFKDIKSVLPGYYTPENVVEFKDMPHGQTVTVIAFRLDEKNNKAMVGSEELVLGDEESIFVVMEEMDLADFKEYLAQFN